MVNFTDNVFSQVQSSVCIDSLAKSTEPVLEIVHEDFKSKDTLSLINANYRIVIVKTMQYIANKSLEKNRNRLLYVLEEYSRVLDIYPQIYEETSGYVPLNMTMDTYYIVLKLGKNIRAILDFIVSLDNIGIEGFSNSMKIYKASGNLGILYGHYDTEISPNGELISYLRDLKYGDIPFSFYPNQEQFMKDLSQMQTVAEAMTCSLFDSSEEYNYYFVIGEIRKWLRTSKKRWIAGQIEERKINYDDYNQKARKFYENR